MRYQKQYTILAMTFNLLLISPSTKGHSNKKERYLEKFDQKIKNGRMKKITQKFLKEQQLHELFSLQERSRKKKEELMKEISPQSELNSLISRN